MLRKIYPLLLSGLMIFAIASSSTVTQSLPDEKLRNRAIEWEPTKAVEEGKVTTRKVNFSEVHSLTNSSETDVRKVTPNIARGFMVQFAALAVISLSKSNDRHRTIIFQ